MKMEIDNLDFKPDVLLVDGQEPKLSMNIIKNNPKMISIIDAGRAVDDVIELCKHVNYIVCSREFAEEVTGVKVNYKDANSLGKIFEKLIELFPSLTISI